MAKKNTTEKSTESLESQVKQFEKRLTKLEVLIAKKFARKKREYTEEERKTIRARLLSGQEAAKKKLESKTKTSLKNKTGRAENDKVTEVI
jgi:hypothetical protein